MMILTPITEEGLQHVLLNLSPEDRAELRAAQLPMSAEAVLREGWQTCPGISGQVERDGEPVALFGCRPAPELGEGVGIPWMMATPGFRAEPRRAMELSHEVVGRMQKTFPRLVNLVHVGHSYAMRWLPRIGFVISDEPCGPGGEFRQFEWSAQHV